MGLNAEVELNCIASLHKGIIPMTKIIPTDELPNTVEAIKNGWLSAFQGAATVVRGPLPPGVSKH